MLLFKVAPKKDTVRFDKPKSIQKASHVSRVSVFCGKNLGQDTHRPAWMTCNALSLHKISRWQQSDRSKNNQFRAGPCSCRALCSLDIPLLHEDNTTHVVPGRRIKDCSLLDVWSTRNENTRRVSHKKVFRKSQQCGTSQTRIADFHGHHGREAFCQRKGWFTLLVWQLKRAFSHPWQDVFKYPDMSKPVQPKHKIYRSIQLGS